MNKKDLWKALKTPLLSDYGCRTCKHYINAECILSVKEWQNCQLVGGHPENFYKSDNRWEWNGETYDE